MRPRSAAKRQAAIDKTVVQALEQIPVERLSAVGLNEFMGHTLAALQKCNEAVYRHYASKESLTPTELEQYSKQSKRAGDVLANIMDKAAQAPLEGLPLPTNGHQIIEGVALQPMPPGMVEYLKERG